MANESTPPTKGTTEQAAPSDDLLMAALELVLTGNVPKETAQKIEARVEARIVQALADQPREAVRDKSILFIPTGLMDTLLDAAIRQFVQDKTDQTVNAVRNAKALTNPPEVNALAGAQEGADPVDLATGQLIYRHVDLRLDGAGIHFEFTRTYRSQSRYPNGPLGVGWDYNLNLWLHVVSADVVVVGSGEFREDRYTLTTPRPGAPDETSYYAPPDGYHAILRSNDITGSFDLTRPDGLTYQFEVDQEAGSGLHRIKKIVDTFGNSLVFEYITTLTAHVIHIYVNDPTRVVTLHFDDLGRIDLIGDYSGRVVSYTYDDYDDLVAVTLPATKDYPLGRSTFYQYSSLTGPVAHQLLSVSDADGRNYLTVEYGNDDGFVDYARVVRQRDDQGEWLLEYANLATDEAPGLFTDVLPNDTVDINTATRYTALVRPGGHYVEHWFNKGGNLLFKQENYLGENGQFARLSWSFLYNADGQMIAGFTPQGVLTQDLNGRDQYLLAHGRAATDPLTDDIAPSADERRAFGNHLGRVRRGAGPQHAWPPPFPVTMIFANDIARRFSYDPRFQLITSESDPRTTHSLDPTVATRVTTYEYRADGALLKVTYPAVSLPDGGQGGQAIERFEHDPRGRLTRLIDAEGHVTQRDYFPPGEKRKPEPVFPPEPPLPPLSDVSIAGHLQAISVGKGEPDEATTHFDVNARGSVISIVDPRSFVTRMKVDDTDRPVEVVRTLKRAGKPDVPYVTRFRYTIEGKLKRQDHDLQDDAGTPLFDGHEVHFYRYDDAGLLVRESFGGLAPALWLVGRHTYDAEGLPARSISPGGSITRFQYDPRRLLVATTKGFETPDASTERIRYDSDGRRRAVIDGRGSVIRYDYDEFGRVSAIVQVVDHPVGLPDDRPLQLRQGHTRRFAYNALDKVVLERFFEWRSKDSYVLLSRAATEYDERGQAIKLIHDLFPAPVSATLDDFKDAPPVNSIQIETWFFLDKNGRISEKREGVVHAGLERSAGRSMQYTYDASGRETSFLVRLLDPQVQAVARTSTTYDANGNVVRVDTYDFEYDARGALTNTEVISREVEFDSLNRRIAEIDGLGNRTEYRYDSRDLVIERRDALGNVIRFDYDRYGRRITMTEEADQQKSIRTTYCYDDDGQVRMILRGDETQTNLVTTSYDYDALHRQTAVILAAGTPLERKTVFHYDEAGNVIEKIHANHLREVMEYDTLNRLTHTTFDRTAVDVQAPVLGATFEIFQHDGLGRLTHAENDVSTIEASFDSLGRATQEVQTYAGVGLKVMRSFNALGNRKEQIYPSGRKLRFHYDQVGRLQSVDDVQRGTPNVGVPGSGSREIVQRSYIGMRLREDRYGNGSSTLYHYDPVGRCIEMHHCGTRAVSLLQQIHLYDAVGNRCHDWQSGSEAIIRSQAYAYDGIHRLVAVGKVLTTLPNLRPFLPPSTPRQPLGGQAAIDKALAPLSIPLQALKDSYTYDPGGNRIGESSPARNYTVDGVDQIVGESYDLDGDPVVIGTRTLVYDQHRRLVQVKEGGTALFSAVYDALERRLVVTDGTHETRFVYDGQSEIAEYRDGELFSEHVLAVAPDERVHLSVEHREYAVHRDLVGSTCLLIDESGKPVARFEFEPYGRVNTAQEGPFYRYRFMGREWDASIDLYHFRARHYDPETGRFLQRDPLASEPGRSAYQAFGSNPLLYIDPFGTLRSHIGDPRPETSQPLSPLTVVEGEKSSQLEGAEAPIVQRPLETSSPPPTHPPVDAKEDFINRVDKAYRDYRTRTKQPLPDLRDDQVENIKGTKVPTRKDTAAAVNRLLDEANRALEAAKAAHDPNALNTNSITVVSGYRGSAHQASLVRRYLREKYLDETAASRARLPEGEYSEAAVQNMIHYISPKIAAPGFSNHQAGLSIDFWQVRTSGHTIGNSTGHDATDKWRQTWFFKWMKTRPEGSTQTNAQRFGFEEYQKEPWHWTYHAQGQ